MRPVPPIAAAQFGVFSRRQALEAGWTRSALAHAVHAGNLHPLRPGAFVAAEAVVGDTPAAERRRLAVAAVAAMLTTPASVASHSSAAILSGLPTWTLPHGPCLTVPPETHWRSVPWPPASGRAAARALYRQGPLVRTAIARTVVDLGREHGIEDAVVAADAALHVGAISREALAKCAVDCSGWPGIRRARAALDLVDELAESPIESVSRIRLAQLGLPAPEIQMTIFTETGLWLARVDFYWDEFGVVGEVDGKIKYEDQPGSVLWKEKQRQERLEDAGLIVVRWGRAELDAPTRLAARLRSGFARGSRRNSDERRWIARPAPRG